MHGVLMPLLLRGQGGGTAGLDQLLKSQRGWGEVRLGPYPNPSCGKLDSLHHPEGEGKELLFKAVAAWYTTFSQVKIVRDVLL